METVQFKSWDEVQPGDELIWLTLSMGIIKGYHIRFRGFRGGFVDADYLGTEGYSDGTNWSMQISKSDGPFGPQSGWARVNRTLEYDPKQQGDREDDV